MFVPSKKGLIKGKEKWGNHVKTNYIQRNIENEKTHYSWK